MPLHLSFSLLLYLEKFCVQAFLSLGSAEESSRGFHALLTFVSSLWWCFWISPHQEWVWSEVTEVIDSNVTNLTGENLCNLSCSAIWEYLNLKLCNLGLIQFYTLQWTHWIAGRSWVAHEGSLISWIFFLNYCYFLIETCLNLHRFKLWNTLVFLKREKKNCD